MDVLNLLSKKNGPGVGTRIQVPLPFEEQVEAIKGAMSGSGSGFRV